MGSVFDTLIMPMDETVDSLYSEKFFFAPMLRRPVDGKVDHDPARDQISSLPAIFDNQEITQLTGAAGSSASNPPPPHASSTPQIVVMTQYLPQGVRVGDQFVRERDGKTYQVTNIKPDGLTRQFLDVVLV